MRMGALVKWMYVFVHLITDGNEGLKCIPGPFKVGMYTHTTCTTVLFKVIQSTIHVIKVNVILGLIKLIFLSKVTVQTIQCGIFELSF